MALDSDVPPDSIERLTYAVHLASSDLRALLAAEGMKNRRAVVLAAMIQHGEAGSSGAVVAVSFAERLDALLALVED